MVIKASCFLEGDSALMVSERKERERERERERGGRERELKTWNEGKGERWRREGGKNCLNHDR